MPRGSSVKGTRTTGKRRSDTTVVRTERFGLQETTDCGELRRCRLPAFERVVPVPVRIPVVDREPPEQGPPDLLRHIVAPGTAPGLHAVDVASGDRRWVFETDETVHNARTVVGETLYFGRSGGALYASST